MGFLFDKKVVVKRYEETMGAYNRPIQTFVTKGTYSCMVAQSNSSTSQLQVQRQNTTNLTLYTEPEADIRVGDTVFIYKLDEYDNIILDTEYTATADKPYEKRTHLAVPLLGVEEV